MGKRYKNIYIEIKIEMFQSLGFWTGIFSAEQA